MVIRMPHGRGIKALEHHSESLDTFLGPYPWPKSGDPFHPL